MRYRQTLGIGFPLYFYLGFSILGDPVLFSKVNFVGTDNTDRITWLILLIERDPFLQVLHRIHIADIIDEDPADSILQISRNQTFEPLLAGSVPELKPVASVVIHEVLGEEVDSDGRLIYELVTFDFSSK